MGCSSSKSTEIVPSQNAILDSKQQSGELAHDLGSDLIQKESNVQLKREQAVKEQLLEQLDRHHFESVRDAFSEYSSSSEYDDEEIVSNVSLVHQILEQAGPSEIYNPEACSNDLMLDDQNADLLRINKDYEPLFTQQEDTEEPVCVTQNVTIRYLDPPKLRTPSPDLIFERQESDLPSAQAPILMRHRLAEPRTPTPILIREMPPNKIEIEPKSETQVRIVAAALPAPRTVQLERVYEPDSQREIIVEKWLPYERAELRRPTIVQRVGEFCAHAPTLTHKNQIVEVRPSKANVKYDFEIKEELVERDPLNFDPYLAVDLSAQTEKPIEIRIVDRIVDLPALTHLQHLKLGHVRTFDHFKSLCPAVDLNEQQCKSSMMRIDNFGHVLPVSSD